MKYCQKIHENSVFLTILAIFWGLWPFCIIMSSLHVQIGYESSYIIALTLVHVGYAEKPSFFRDFCVFIRAFFPQKKVIFCPLMTIFGHFLKKPSSFYFNFNWFYQSIIYATQKCPVWHWSVSKNLFQLQNQCDVT